MPRITISYRRDDSLGITGRIFDRLATIYGRDTVFRDIDSVHVGVDFRAQIAKALSETDVVIAVIGPKWMGPRSGQNRLMNGADPVRVEIETALRKEVPLIPVLVSGGIMPSAEKLPDTLNSFAYRNALTIDSGKDFDIHMTRLFNAITDLVAPDMAPVPLMPPRNLERAARPEAVVSASASLAQITSERDALLAERDALRAELVESRQRERAFTMELNYTAEETAATQQQLDELDFAQRLETIHRSFAKRMIVHNLFFAFLCAAVVFLGFYAFLR